MKNTGIVRKIDGLGRIVLPKELRRILNIHPGDDFQITVYSEKIILEKFSILKNYEEIINDIINCFSNVYNYMILVTIGDRIINSNEIVSNAISNIIQSRKKYVNEYDELNIINDNINVHGKMILLPIVINSDLMGSIIVVGTDSIYYIDNVVKVLFNLIKKVLVNNW